MSFGLSIKIKRILMIICLCVFAGAFLVACGEDDDTIHVDGVTLNYETYKVVVGSKFQLVANVIPDEATNKKLYFRSGNTGVAFVDSNGLVTGVKTGTTQIFATSDDGKFEANCIVEVVDAKVKLGTPQNLRYDSNSNALVWDAITDNVNGYSAKYKVRVISDGVTNEYETLTNSFTEIGVNKAIEPGKLCSVSIKTIGNESYYNDSDYTNSYQFEILPTPSGNPTVVNVGEKNFITVNAVNGQEVSSYQLVITRYINGVEQALSEKDENLFKTDEYLTNNPQLIENSQVRWEIPEDLSEGTYIYKVCLKGDSSNNIFDSKFVSGLSNLIKLGAPTSLALSGTIVSWTPVNNASGYRIYIYSNNELKWYSQTPISAYATSYDVKSNISNLENYLVYMKSVGNGFNIVDSALSAECATQTLDTPSNLIMTKGEGDRYTLTWDAVSNADGYKIYVNNYEYTIGGDVAEYVFYSTNFKIGGNSVQVMATSSALNLKDSSKSATYTVTKLASPTLYTSGGNVIWTAVAGATEYEIVINSVSTSASNSLTYDSSINSFELGEEFSPGDYNINIYAKGNGSNIIDSIVSEDVTYTKLGSPTNLRITSENGTDYLRWAYVDGATNYQIEIHKSSTNETNYVTTQGLSYAISNYMSTFAYGEYTFRIRTYGSSSASIYYLNSGFTDSINAFRLGTPDGLGIENGIITWNALNYASMGIDSSLFNYEVKIDNTKRTVETNSYDTNVGSVSAGTKAVSIRAVIVNEGKVNDNLYLLSSGYSSVVTMNKLSSPTNIRMTDTGALVWDSVISQDSTEIGNYTVIFTYSNATEFSYQATSNECPNSIVSDVKSFGKVNVRIIANGGNGYLNSQRSTLVTYTKLATPTLTVNNGALSWDYVNDGDGRSVLNYKVFVKEEGATVETPYDISGANIWDMASITGGKRYEVSIMAVGSGSYVLNSAKSGSIQVTKLIAPDASTIRATNDLEGIQWSVTQTDQSFTYDIVINYITATNEVKNMGTINTAQNAYFNFPDNTEWAGGTYQVKVRTKAPAGSRTINSNYSEVVEVIRLSTPTGLTVSNSILTWNEVANATNYDAKLKLGTNDYVNYRDLVNQSTRQLQLANNTDEEYKEIAEFVGSITMCIKALASTSTSSGSIIINSATSLTKSIERYADPTITVNDDNEIAWSSELDSVNGHILYFTPTSGGATINVNLASGINTFDMNTSVEYNGSYLQINTPYYVSIQALGDGISTLSSPISEAYTYPVIKLIAPDQKIGEDNNVVNGNWRVENGVLVWDLITGATSYIVEGYDESGNYYNSGNIESISGSDVAECLPTYPEIGGRLTFTITSVGGLTEDYHYINSEPSVSSTINKLATPSDLRVENGEIEWERRKTGDGTRDVVSEITDESSNKYTILSDYAVSYNNTIILMSDYITTYVADGTKAIDAIFKVSDFFENEATVSVSVSAIGTVDSTNVPLENVYLSSNSTDTIDVLIGGQPTNLRIENGVLVWTDISSVKDFELVLEGQDRTVVYTTNSYSDLQGYSSKLYDSVYVRHAGTLSGYSGSSVNSRTSNVLTNIQKLPSISSYGIDEDGDFIWEYSADYVSEDMKRGLVLSVDNDDENSVNINQFKYTLNVNSDDIQDVRTYLISGYVPGSTEVNDSGTSYLKSDTFSFNTYKFASPLSVGFLNGLVFTWNVNDLIISVDGEDNVRNNKFIVQYQFKEFGTADGAWGEWQEFVFEDVNKMSMSDLGEYNIRVCVASSDVNILRSEPTSYDGKFSFNKFESGNGSPENPFVISSTTATASTELSTAEEKLAYIYVLNDKYFRLAEDIDLHLSVSANETTNNGATIFEGNINIPHYEDGSFDNTFTGGLDGDGHSINNFRCTNVTRTALFKSILGRYRTNSEGVQYNASTCLSDPTGFYGRSGIIIDLTLNALTPTASVDDKDQDVLLFYGTTAEDGIAFVSHYSYGGWLVNTNVTYKDTSLRYTELDLTNATNYYGGLVCYMYSFVDDSSYEYLDARIIGCTVDVDLQFYTQNAGVNLYVGGLVGVNQGGSIIASINKGNLMASGIGGIVYQNEVASRSASNLYYYGTVSGCENSASLRGLPSTGNYGRVGGICALNSSFVLSSKNSGQLSVTNYHELMAKDETVSIPQVSAYVGGIVAWNASGNYYVANCLNVGALNIRISENIAVGYVGGIVGENGNNNATNIVGCLFDNSLTFNNESQPWAVIGNQPTQATNASCDTVTLKSTENFTENQTIVQYLNTITITLPENLYNTLGISSVFTQEEGFYPVLERKYGLN